MILPGICLIGAGMLEFVFLPDFRGHRSMLSPLPPHSGPERLVSASQVALEEADVAVLVTDMARVIRPEDIDGMKWLAAQCRELDALCFMVLNKADLLKDPGHRADKFEQWVDAFEVSCHAEGLIGADGLEALPVPRVHVTSAKLGHGVPELRSTLMRVALPRPWQFSSTVRSLQSDLERAEEVIREQIFKNLHKVRCGREK